MSMRETFNEISIVFSPGRISKVGESDKFEFEGQPVRLVVYESRNTMVHVASRKPTASIPVHELGSGKHRIDVFTEFWHNLLMRAKEGVAMSA